MTSSAGGGSAGELLTEGGDCVDSTSGVIVAFAKTARTAVESMPTVAASGLLLGSVCGGNDDVDGCKKFPAVGAVPGIHSLSEAGGGRLAGGCGARGGVSAAKSWRIGDLIELSESWTN